MFVRNSCLKLTEAKKTRFYHWLIFPIFFSIPHLRHFTQNQAATFTDPCCLAVHRNKPFKRCHTYEVHFSRNFDGNLCSSQTYSMCHDFRSNFCIFHTSLIKLAYITSIDVHIANLVVYFDDFGANIINLVK